MIVRIAKSLIKAFMKNFDIGIISYTNLIRLQKIEAEKELHFKSELFLDLLTSLPSRHTELLLSNRDKSNSDLFQDFFVLSELEFKRNGFFVEFGASNGVTGSNTLLLEKEFAWRGILAEPARNWHGDLRKNRPMAFIEESCVFNDSNLLVEFTEIPKTGISALTNFVNSDHHADLRKDGQKYLVQTISLVDLLVKYNAPQEIEYLSIDTEGSEYEILSSFDFSKYEIKVITCEHNYSSSREKLQELLTSHGYIRRFQNISYYDDWWVKA